MNNQIYQIHIILDHVKPRIWRRILIKATTSLEDLHKIIQTTMGWTNSHLHHFKKGNNYFVPKDDEGFGLDYTKITISDLLREENDRIKYEYDFGDGWKHTIKLEKILQAEHNEIYPICLKGKNACPFEDCGGPRGYARLLSAFSELNEKEPDEEIYDLVYDLEPDYFDLPGINEMFQQEDFGCFTWFI